jgi:hypothetical protein
MLLVVEERNHLVHHSASAVDLESLESCNAFSAQLDAQRERVMPSHQNLVEMVNVVRAYGRVMSDNIDEIVERLMAGAPSHDA